MHQRAHLQTAARITIADPLIRLACANRPIARQLSLDDRRRLALERQ
jgi:hypothetical protein